ncbi:MAG: DUF2065 family protein [Pseudomonadota bacterium]
MDLAAALALVLILEGMALVVFARSVPELMAEMTKVPSAKIRTIGLLCVGVGAIGYLMIRGGPPV